MEKIIYSKYSNDRSRRFQIRTDILKDDLGALIVRKSPLSKEAESHIDYIYRMYEALKRKYNGVLTINSCEVVDNRIDFKFITGKTLEQLLNEYYSENNYAKILALLDKFVEIVKYNSDVNSFEITEEFKSVFGEVDFDIPLECTSIADIDLIFENIIVDKDQWHIIDYEWTFLFPVPVNFIIYRALEGFFQGLYDSNEKNIGVDIWKRYGISSNEIIIYKKMINGFEKYVQNGGFSMKKIHKSIGQRVYYPYNAIKTHYNTYDKLIIQVYFGYDWAYEEKNSYYIQPIEEKLGRVDVKIEIPYGCTSIRFDPASTSCIFQIDKMEVDGIEWKEYVHNGIAYADNSILFADCDPQISILGINDKKVCTLWGSTILLDVNQAKLMFNYIQNQETQEKYYSTLIKQQEFLLNAKDIAIKDLQKNNDDLWVCVNDLNNAINEIAHSFSWKITAPLRKTKKIIKRIIKHNIKRESTAENISEEVIESNHSDLNLKVEENSKIDEKSLYIDHVMRIPETDSMGEEYVGESEEKPIVLSKEDVKYIAFYLPQFHSFPENDMWWGKNFTEWTNVTKAVPLFNGHYQPRLAGDLGYYQLNQKDAIKEQMELATKYGVYGFCIYYYWFSGKTLMNTPLDLIMKNEELNLPFCICWANENWSRRWDGKASDILISQDYGDGFAIRFIQDISKYLNDSRYIKINGKPLLVIYNANEIPDLKNVLLTWREYCRNNTIGEIHISAVDFALNEVSRNAGFDDFIEFPPHSVFNYDKKKLNDTLYIAEKDFTGEIFDFQDIVNKKEYLKNARNDLIPGVFLAWDNTARKKKNATIFHNYKPEKFKEWLSDVTNLVKNSRDVGMRFVFINAWNEWAEGTYLEPDRKYGYAALKQVKEVLLDSREKKSIIFVGHDACFNGAQVLAIHIIESLCKTFGYQVYVVLKKGGVLLEKFFDLAFETICLEDLKWTEDDFAKWIKATGSSKAICNTVVSGRIVKSLSENGIQVISLIHEMEKLISKNGLSYDLEMINIYAEKIVFASDYVRKSCDNVLSIDKDKTVILPQGMFANNPFLENREVAKKEIYELYNISSESKLVLAVAFGDYRKGIDLFAETAHKVKEQYENVEFLWVGAVIPEMQEKIQKYIDVDIKCVGRQIEITELMKYYAAADLFLLSSREDPFPTVVMEAMFSYLPVVAFRDGGGYVELIEAGNGLLVEMENTTEMANSVIRYLKDEQLLEETGKKAHDCIAFNHTFTKYVAKLLELLGEKISSVSVVIPNYNYERYLRERIDSVLQQDYPIAEIIILDDASTDNSASILREYEKKYPETVKVFYNEQNQGSVFRQWEKGFNLANSDYVWIAEADDLSDREFLKVVMQKMNLNDDLIMCYSQSFMIDEEGNVIAPNYFCYTDDISVADWKNDYIENGKTEIQNHLTVKNTIPNVSAVVFKKEKYDDIFREAEKYTVAGDWFIYVEILKNGGKIGFVSKSLNYHRRHSGSVTMDLKAENHFQEVVAMQDYAAKVLNQAVSEDAIAYRDFLKDYLKV